MGQNDKARAMVAERYHFDTTVAADADEILKACDRAAGAAGGRLGGSFKKQGSGQSGERRHVAYELMGPGGLVSIATITVLMSQSGDRTTVRCRLENFLFQKRSLGMKPTINGSAQLDKFVGGLKAELGAMSGAQ